MIKLKIEKSKEAKPKVQESDKVKNIKFTILVVVCIILFSAVLAPVELQNDTFYTIKIGEHIVNTKTVDMQDPFSWHEGLPYTYPHWAYDLLTYMLFSKTGFMGIYISTIVLSCILGVIVYFTNNKISKNKLVSFFITLGTMYLLKPYIAARAQLVTFSLLELTILCIEQFLDTKKKRYAVFLVIISICIANLHCAVWPFFFVLFLPYVAEYVFSLDYIKCINAIRKFIYTSKLNKYEVILLKKENNSEIKSKKENKDKEKNNKKNNEKKRIKYIEKINRNKERLEKKIANQESNYIHDEEIIKQNRENPYKLKIERKSAAKWLIVIMIICAFTGLLTPIKGTPYTYLIDTMEGNTTKSISEHLPLTLINNIPIMITLAVFVFMIAFTDVKIRLKDLFMVAGLVLLMFMTRRQVSMYALLCSAVFAKLIANLFAKYDEEGTKNIQDFMITALGTTATMAVIALFMICQIKGQVNKKFVNESDYPIKAADYIVNNIDMSSMKLFNEYNYGSYLLYRNIPVFIDSRADLYAPEFNKQKKDIFGDYINTANISRYYEKTFDEYEITHIILAKNSKLNMLLSKDKDHYVELYSDDNFIIYKRNIDN